MIAASKMRRAQEMALQSRPYADNMRNLLADLAAQPAPDDEEYIHPCSDDARSRGRRSS